MTQFLIEEAAFGALDLHEEMARSGALAERQEAEKLMTRHAELTALRDRMRDE